MSGRLADAVKTLLLIGHARQARRWEHALLERLRNQGFEVRTTVQSTTSPAPRGLNGIIRLEAKKLGASSASLAAPFPLETGGMAELVIDLTGKASPADAKNVLTLSISGAKTIDEGLSRLRSTTDPAPDIIARLNGKAVAIASPMLGDRVWFSRDCTDVLAAAQNLIVMCIRRFAADRLAAIDEPVAQTPSRPFLLGYGLRLGKGLASRLLQKLKPGSRPFYWQVGYRLHSGAGVAETRRLDGAPFTLLEDDGQRFYADPFAFEHQGRSYLFVEEFPYALGRGNISVTEIGPDGTCAPPRAVLEEPHHLSYPNVFQRDGTIFMIPESGAANEVVLYRAEQFPDRWVRDTVLLAGHCFNDATLVERDGRLWMFGTERIGRGSASDTLMVYSASDLRGPWQPHGLNPILIDRAGARPGGHVIHKDGKVFLPMQDGTLKYGGGLSLREIIRLDDEDVVLGPSQAVTSGPAWHGTGIHTLTRSGWLEMIDSAP